MHRWIPGQDLELPWIIVDTVPDTRDTAQDTRLSTARQAKGNNFNTSNNTCLVFIVIVRRATCKQSYKPLPYCTNLDLSRTCTWQDFEGISVTICLFGPMSRDKDDRNITSFWVEYHFILSPIIWLLLTPSHNDF